METWIGVDAALSSTHFVANIRHHVTLDGGKRSISEMQTDYNNEVVNIGLAFAQRKNRNFYLINVFTVGTISTETSRAWAALPGAIWRTVAIHSPKARVRQTAICKGLRHQEWTQNMDTELNAEGHICKVCLQKFSFLICNVFHLSDNAG